MAVFQSALLRAGLQLKSLRGYSKGLLPRKSSRLAFQHIACAGRQVASAKYSGWLHADSECVLAMLAAVVVTGISPVWDLKWQAFWRAWCVSGLLQLQAAA